MERNYSVYQLIFLDGKLYFGQTKNTKVRFKSVHMYHTSPVVYNAMLQTGWDNIKKEVIADHLSYEDSRKLEGWLIERYDTTNPENGYNVSKGIAVSERTNANKKASRKRNYDSHMEEYRTRAREYYVNHREERIVYAHKHRAQKNTQHHGKY